MERLTRWLSHTHLSATFQDVKWVIPVSQTIHILTVAVVMSSVLLLNLRLAGLVAPSVPQSVFARRYLQGVWWGLPILLATGLVQIIAEPRRDLTNWTFWLKMSLLLIALLITLILQYRARQESPAWQSRPRRVLIVVLAWLGLACWVAIVFCGRWIAYTYTP